MSRERGLLSVSICNSNPQNFIFFLLILFLSLSFFVSFNFLLSLAGLCCSLPFPLSVHISKQAFLKKMRKRAVYVFNSLSLCFKAGFLGSGFFCTHARGDEKWFSKTVSFFSLLHSTNTKMRF